MLLLVVLTPSEANDPPHAPKSPLRSHRVRHLPQRRFPRFAQDIHGRSARAAGARPELHHDRLFKLARAPGGGAVRSGCTRWRGEREEMLFPSGDDLFGKVDCAGPARKRISSALPERDEKGCRCLQRSMSLGTAKFESSMTRLKRSNGNGFSTSISCAWAGPAVGGEKAPVSLGSRRMRDSSTERSRPS